MFLETVPFLNNTNLGSLEGSENLFQAIVAFYSLIPRQHWLTIEGAVPVILYKVNIEGLRSPMPGSGEFKIAFVLGAVNLFASSAIQPGRLRRHRRSVIAALGVQETGKTGVFLRICRSFHPERHTVEPLRLRQEVRIVIAEHGKRNARLKEIGARSKLGTNSSRVPAFARRWKKAISICELLNPKFGDLNNDSKLFYSLGRNRSGYSTRFGPFRQWIDEGYPELPDDSRR